MGAVWLLARSTARHQRRSLLVATVFVGVAAAVVLTTVAGARRASTAYDRLLEAMKTADVSVEVSPRYFEDIAALPGVEAVAPGSFMFVAPPGLDVAGELLAIAGVDERFGTDVHGGLIVEGRRPRPDRVDEVVVNPSAADALDVGVGETVTMSSLTPDQIVALFNGGDPGGAAGPTVDVTVVGVIRTEEDLASGLPIMLLTPAFYDAHEDDIGHFDDILDVRLVDGDAGVAAFERAVERVVPASEGAIVTSSAETTEKIEDATEVQSVSLMLVAAAAALAGFVAIGQVLTRLAASSSDDQLRLDALGVDRRQRFLALALPAVPVAVVGAALAAMASVVASPTMPTGFARRVEPDPGVAVDWLVLAVGFVAVVVIVGIAAVVPAWRVTGRVRPDAVAGRRASTVARLAGLGASPAAVTGVRMAFEPGRGRTSVPVRAAWLGAVVGVAGTVASLTFGAGLGWAVGEERAYGLTWDATIVGPVDDRAVERLVADDDVGGVAVVQAAPIRLAGVPSQSYSVEAAAGGGFVTMLGGRVPEGTDEVLVGAGTLDRLDLDVGDTVEAAGLNGSSPRPLTIVGWGVFPELTHPAVPEADTGSYDDFALFTGALGDALADDAGGELFSVALVRWRPGVDDVAASQRLEAEGAPLQVLDEPDRFVNVARVEAFPSIVAGFLALVAAVAVGHALVTSVRRRAHDLAVLRTLGFVGSQLRAAVAWQASALGAIGLVLGLPLGFIVGRAAWVFVADSLSIDDHVPTAWLALGATVPAVVVLVNLLALWPGWRAARARPADALRVG